MSCTGCTKKESDGELEKKHKEAIELANTTGEWYKVYVDEFGLYQIIRADIPNYPQAKIIVSPEHQDNKL